MAHPTKNPSMCYVYGGSVIFFGVDRADHNNNYKASISKLVLCVLVDMFIFLFLSKKKLSKCGCEFAQKSWYVLCFPLELLNARLLMM